MMYNFDGEKRRFSDSDEHMPDDDAPRCPKCECDDVDWRGGDWVVNVGDNKPLMDRFDIYLCNCCYQTFTV